MNPQIQFIMGSWQDLGPGCSAIRHAVFVEEQGVPLELELDAFDEHAVHVLALAVSDGPIGTGRLVLNDPEAPRHDSARIGRLAVVPAWRRRGVGQQLLERLLAEARHRGCTAAHLHAQVDATPLYARVGFEPVGLVFDEAGIPHQMMILARL